MRLLLPFISFFFTHTATSEIYTLSLHDALPISLFSTVTVPFGLNTLIFSVTSLLAITGISDLSSPPSFKRSEEHTSELQSRGHLVCRLLLEKKKNTSKLQLSRHHHLSHHHKYLQ